MDRPLLQAAFKRAWDAGSSTDPEVDALIKHLQADPFPSKRRGRFHPEIRLLLDTAGIPY